MGLGGVGFHFTGVLYIRLWIYTRSPNGITVFTALAALLKKREHAAVRWWGLGPYINLIVDGLITAASGSRLYVEDKFSYPVLS